MTNQVTNTYRVLFQPLPFAWDLSLENSADS